MANYQPFEIPAGVDVQITDKGVSIEHAGDIILHGTIGGGMDRVVSSEGSVTLAGKLSLGSVEAPNGTVRVVGPVEATRVLGSVVEITSTDFTAKTVRGERQIKLGECKIKIDVLISPRIEIEPKASGRVPIIECHNELGPNAIKGGFSVAEYDELLGDVESYLAERGVDPLQPASDEEEEEDEEEDEPSDLIIEAEDIDEAEAEFVEEPESLEAIEEEDVDDPDTFPDVSRIKVGVTTTEAAPISALPNIDEDPADDEPEEIDIEIDEIEDLELDSGELPDSDDLSLPPGARSVFVDDDFEDMAKSEVSMVDEDFSDIKPEPEESDVHVQLEEVLAELRACYEDGEHPPVLSELQEMVEAREYDEIVNRLPQLWNDLVKHHRERCMSIRRQVTTTFNNIMSIVKNAPTVNMNQ